MPGAAVAVLDQVRTSAAWPAYAGFTARFTGQFKGNRMKVNEGVIDRSLRVIAGLVLIGLAATGTVGLWGYIGIVPLLTGAVGICPIYSLLGINSCPTPRR